MAIASSIDWLTHWLVHLFTIFLFKIYLFIFTMFFLCIAFENIKGAFKLCIDFRYHLECLSPPLDHVPIDDWFCPNCSTHRSPNSNQAASSSTPATTTTTTTTTKVLRKRGVRTVAETANFARAARAWFAGFHFNSSSLIARNWLMLFIDHQILWSTFQGFSAILLMKCWGNRASRYWKRFSWEMWM